MIADRSTLEKIRSILLSTMMVLSVVALGTVGSSGVVAAETELTSCTDITSSGTYVLGADLTKDQTGNGDACIEITADDVHLDGQGHTVTGGTPIEIPNYGIHVNGSTNVTVADVTVDGWDEIGHGIRADGATDVTFRDVTATNNSYGVSVLRTDGFTVENVSAVENNRAGMQAYNATMGVFRDVIAVNNSDDVDGFYGLRVVEESSDVLVENATVTGTGNNGDGIKVNYEILSNVTIRDVTVLDNDGAGLHIESGAVVVENVTARGNNWSFVMEDVWQADGPPTVQGLDIGDSTAPNTTLSFEAWNVRVRGNTTPPSHSTAVGIGRYFEVEEIGDGYLDATVDYEHEILGRVSEVKLYPWRFDGTEWIKYPGLAIDTGENTVSVNVTNSGTVGIFGVAPVASYEVSPVNDTIVQGEPLEVELTNVMDTKGYTYENYTTIEFVLPNGSTVYAGTSVDNGTGMRNLTVLDGNETEDLATGSYTDLESNLIGEDFINDTYDVEVAASPVASFDVSATNETIAQGEELSIDITNVTHVRGGPFDGYQTFRIDRPHGGGDTVFKNVSIENGEVSTGLLSSLVSADQLEPGEYTGLEVQLEEDASINDAYGLTVKANSFAVESEFAGVVHDDSGLAINATWLPIQDGEANLTVAGQEIPDPVIIENHNVSTTIDLSEHLDPETTTDVVTVELDGDPYEWYIDPLTDEVRLVHEAYDLDEGYTRWSIPQPADVYVSDGVVDMTQWSNAETTYDDVGFQVNAGETVTEGEDLHKGLYVNANGFDERIGYDFVTPGEEGLAPGGAETIDEGWNLLSSNYDVSSGNETLNLDLNTVSSLPATAADYEGDEGMVAHNPSTFVRIGGDEVVDPYDTYWVYVDVGVESETRAISTAEYDSAKRAAILEGDS